MLYIDSVSVSKLLSWLSSSVKFETMTLAMLLMNRDPSIPIVLPWIMLSLNLKNLAAIVIVCGTPKVVPMVVPSTQSFVTCEVPFSPVSAAEPTS